MLHGKITLLLKLLKTASESNDEAIREENLCDAIEELEELLVVAEHIDGVNPFDVDLQEWCEDLNRQLEDLD